MIDNDVKMTTNVTDYKHDLGVQLKVKYTQSKREGKDQKSIQSSTTPDTYQV